jgi:phage tail sheath protein FI
MPEYLAPGVYVEETERGPKPIEGVATSTAAFLGETERGPTAPRFITSYAEFLRLFGDVYDPGKYLPYAVKSFFDNGGRRAYVARIVGAGAAASALTLDGYRITAAGPGTYSDRIYVRLEPGTTKAVRPGDTEASSIGFRLRIFYWSSLPNGLCPFDPVDKASQLPRPSAVEEYDDLSLDPSSPHHWHKRVGNGSASLVTLAVANDAALPARVTGGALTGGSDGAAPGTAQYDGIADEADRRTGLAALEHDRYRDVGIVSAPGATPEVAVKIIAHCERSRFRFAVLDSPPGSAVAGLLDPRTTISDTIYAAYYHPWIVVSDPRSGDRVNIPPSGAVCGIYALTDNTRACGRRPPTKRWRAHSTWSSTSPKPSRRTSTSRASTASAAFPGAASGCGARGRCRAIPCGNISMSAASSSSSRPPSTTAPSG